MAYLNVLAYRELEARWRTEAAKRSRGCEKAACFALAEGYADLITLTGQMHSVDGASEHGSATGPEPSARPDGSTLTRQEKPHLVALG